MPNHVTNKIIIHSQNASEVLAFIKKDDCEFDFNTLIPMPESLDIEESSEKNAAFVFAVTNCYEADLSKESDHKMYFDSVFNKFSSWADELANSKRVYERIKDDSKVLDQFISLSQQVLENFKNYGCSSWYQWCPKYWGTKWNAYEVNVHETTIGFDTASNFPEPVINALIDKFKLTCTYKAYDEGEWFWFVKEYKNGILINDRFKLEEDKKSLALELKGWDFDADDKETENASS